VESIEADNDDSFWPQIEIWCGAKECVGKWKDLRPCPCYATLDGSGQSSEMYLGCRIRGELEVNCADCFRRCPKCEALPGLGLYSPELRAIAGVYGSMAQAFANMGPRCEALASDSMGCMFARPGPLFEALPFVPRVGTSSTESDQEILEGIGRQIFLRQTLLLQAQRWVLWGLVTGEADFSSWESVLSSHISQLYQDRLGSATSRQIMSLLDGRRHILTVRQARLRGWITYRALAPTSFSCIADTEDTLEALDYNVSVDLSEVKELGKPYAYMGPNELIQEVRNDSSCVPDLIRRLPLL
jgi:hypothetical protein